MPFKSIIEDVRGEFGSISRKGFDMKFGYGLKSRSQRAVQDSYLVAIDALRQSCWANVPLELLREVLMRIEDTEGTWPARKSVVACAGVCRSWRDIIKELVKTPEISAQLTFPISLKQPGPRGTLIQCFIKRNRSNQKYHLYLGLDQASNDDGKFLLSARRCRGPTCTDYMLSLNAEDVSRNSSSSTYIGKLNLLMVELGLLNLPAGNFPVAHIAYELNVLGSRGPRRMHCVIDAIPASAIEPGGVAPTQTEFLPGGSGSFPSLSFFRSKSSRMDSFNSRLMSNDKDEMLVLKNKAPRWHEQLQCWCLNFNGRVTVASVKNFQLVASLDGGQEQDDVILQFGKVGKDVFTMDYKYPVSAFQAFAICLSSFDTKIACE